MNAPTFTVEDLRVLNCLTYGEYLLCFSRRDDEYALGKFKKLRSDLFAFIADLDNGNQRLLRTYLDNR